MKVLTSKIVNGKKMFLIEDNNPQGKVFAQVGKPIKKENISNYNPYYVDVKGLNASESTKTNLTPATKITPQEIKKIKESPTNVGNIKIKEAQEKTQRLKEAEEAYKKRKAGAPITPELLAQETQAIGDKISLQNIPGVGQYIPDMLDVTGGIGSMASNLGALPLNLNRGNYRQALLSVAAPLATGALAGIGTQNTGQFVNNLANPLAGTGEIIDNLGNKYLPNAYKLNPNAFKPNPEAYYRTLGKEGIDDAFNSGVIRPKQSHSKYSPEVGKRINVNTPEFPEGSYFNKSGIYSNNKVYNPEYITEVVGKDELFTYPERIVFNENIRVAPKDIPIEQANFYKKDWLKGYKPIETPKTTQNFKSAIGNNGMFNMTNPLAGIKLKANLPEGTVINGVSLNPFKGKIDKKIELIPVPSKFRGEDAYNIKYGDKFIGDFDFEKINDRYVPFSISIDKEYRGQGLGKEAYEVANKLLKSQGKGSLHSSGFFIGDNAKHVWRSLEKTGKAEKIGEDSWKFLKFGGTVKVLDTKIENNKKYYLINE